jgi:excisionase family DNA binding protein
LGLCIVMAIKKLDPLYTVAETAEILNVSEKTVLRLIKDEVLRAIDFGREDGRRGQCGSLRLILRILSATIGVDNWPILSTAYEAIGKTIQNNNEPISRST